MKSMRSVMFPLLLTLAALPGSVLAQSEAPAAAADKVPEAAAAVTAHQVVEATTERIMVIINSAQDYFDKDPDRFFGEVEVVLGEVVDFDSFARGVMGKYASKRAYMSLTSNEEKAQFKARMARFSEIFRAGLVQTYAKGLLAFNGNRIEVLPPQSEVSGQNSVTVVQHIYGEAEKPYVVHYKLRKNKAGQWKLRNVTIEAINLGKVYQSQFSSAAKQYKGDIDQVIDNWSVDPTANEEKAEPAPLAEAS